MREYKFRKIELKSGLTKVKPKEDYREVIKEEAKDGWELIQIFAPPTVWSGSAPFFDLIFHREVKGEQKVPPPP
jgi:hypothetical protein